jgi:glycine/D-amino acid oxidase-like deaminating enzyme
MEIPKSADIVIIGGGVMGASTAYHLAARGHRNILLLEKESFFGQGATGRCAGGVRCSFHRSQHCLSLASCRCSAIRDRDWPAHRLPPMRLPLPAHQSAMLQPFNTISPYKIAWVATR